MILTLRASVTWSLMVLPLHVNVARSLTVLVLQYIWVSRSPYITCECHTVLDGPYITRECRTVLDGPSVAGTRWWTLAWPRDCPCLPSRCLSGWPARRWRTSRRGVCRRLPAEAGGTWRLRAPPRPCRPDPHAPYSRSLVLPHPVISIVRDQLFWLLIILFTSFLARGINWNDILALIMSNK